MRRCGLFFLIMTAAFIVCSAGNGEAGDGEDLVAKLERDVGKRSQAMEELKSPSGEKAVNALMKVVEERRDDWKLQIAAIRLLGEIGNPMASDLLIRVVTDAFFTNECPALKWNGIIALGNFRNDPRVVDALLYRLNENTLYLREAVIQSLGRTGSREAFPYLLSALEDKHFSVRISAIKALGEIEDPQAIPFLEKIVKNETDPLLRDEAVKALGHLK